MKKYLLLGFLLSFVGLLMSGIPSGEALADGNETEGLGPPGIAIAAGSGIVTAGTGLNSATGTISVEVPVGATVKQVLLYWYGRGTPDDTLVVDGIPVPGVNIGENDSGVTLPGGASTTFRADITGLGLVSAGANSLEVEGWNFTFDEGGAGVVVIFQEGTETSDLQIVDGHDFSADDQNLDGTDLEFTFPRKFTFEPAAVDRTAAVDLFVANGDDGRPDAVEITVGGTVTQTGFEDIDVGGTFVSGTSFDSDGFLFSANQLFIIGDDPTVCGGSSTSCADSGSQTLVSLGPAVTIAEASGGTFSLRRLDVAEGIVGFSTPPATAFTITGTLAGGGTVSAGPFDLDDVIDGAGANDFRTHTLPPSFAEAVLTSATIVSDPTGDAFSLDNIVLATPGGEFFRVEDVVNETDGARWDTLQYPMILIPANETMVTAQVISRDPDPSVPSPSGPLPDSIAWLAAALTVPPPPEECVGEIGDYVWLDDGDGCQDSDAGIAGVEVCIYEGCENAEKPIDCTTTDENGFYLFTGLDCGQDYEIKFTRPDGFVETEANSCPDPDNNDDTRDSDCEDGERVCVSLGEDTIVRDLTIDCGYVPECDISVSKTCEVIESEPVDGDVCDVLGKPVALTFDYIPGTTADTAQDSGKAEILFQGPVDDDGVSFVIVTDEDDAAKALAGDGKRFFVGNVAIDATFEANEDTDDFGSQTYIHFFDDASGGRLQSITYHTSCSQPIELGDVIGNATLVEYQGEDGSASAEPPEPGTEECTIQSQIADCDSIKALTGDEPDILTFRVTGGDCSASDNDQEPGKTECSGVFIDPDKAVEVSVNGDPKFTLQPGETFDVERGGDPEIELFQNGAYQFNKFHASCSQPLQAGDRYGANELVALDGIGIGAEVRYLYEVTNNNASETITDISVVDDPLALAGVPGSPIAFLLPGESETLELTAFISETTENTVTVNGKVNDSPICEASDNVTVKVLPPPPCEVGIVFDKLEDDKLKYKLTNAGNRKATLDTLKVKFPAEYGFIKEIKLDGGIWKKGDSADYPGGLPSEITIGVDTDWTEADVTKRQLDIGETRTLEVVFTEKSEGGGWVGIDSAGTATFEEGCAVELITPSGCALGKPTALVFKYTGDACSKTTNLQEGSFECEETGALGSLVNVEMTKDANKFSVAVNGNEVTIAYDDPAGEKMPSEIEYKLTGSDGTQSHTLHTSCSKALSEGDQFGALILEVFVSEF